MGMLQQKYIWDMGQMLRGDPPNSPEMAMSMSTPVMPPRGVLELMACCNTLVEPAS